MKRREFISLLGGGAAAWPLAARAQQGERMRRIGALMSLAEDDPEDRQRRAAFQQAFRQLGWTEGGNLSIENRWYGGDPARARALAKELVELEPDLIVATATPALTALALQIRAIPIVFVGVSDPVGQGFVASLARPGGNATGLSGNATGLTFFEFSVAGKMLEVLKQIAPGIARVALAFNPDSLSNPPFLRAIEAAAPSLATELTKVPVRNAAEIEPALAAIARHSGSGLMCLPDPFTVAHRDLIVGLAARYRLPAIYIQRSFVTAGGLVSYGVDVTDLFRRAAPYVDRILKGAKPADLPVQQPTKFELAINLKAAKALGLDVPPTVLALADEVIE
jgi:putative tryptophan/tyrosine transport system substrate-binding protein